MSKIAVLIPCYNEAATISKVVADFRRVLPEATVYVYDNNSTDSTAALAREAGAVVVAEPRQGKGNVVKAMFADIEADVYLMVDGDDTYPAEMAPELVKPVLEEGYDMVSGDRLSSTYFTENTRPFHNSGNRLVRYLINRLFDGPRINDIMTGYRALSRRAVKTAPLLSNGFEIETEITIHALDKGLKIREIPIDYRERGVGSTSKLNTFSDGAKVLGTVASLFRDYKPLAFFTIVATLLLVAGLALFTPVLIEYFSTGLVPRFPTLIVAGFIILAAMVLYLVGVILEVNTKKHRQLFRLFFLASR